MSKNLGTIWAELGLRLDKFDQQLNQAEARLKTAESTMIDRVESMSKKMTASGKKLTMGVTVPIAGLAVGSVKAFADLDDAMTGSLAIMDNVSDEMRAKMEAAARDIAKNTRYSATQAAESYFFLASAGLDAAESLEAMPRVAAFATAGKFDLARATDLLTDAQSALGLSVDDTAKNMENMTRVSDVLVKANTLANATVEQFSEALTNKAGAALRLLNKDVEEGTAVLAALADQGVKGAGAGEQLNIVLRDLQRSSINNREEFKKMKVEVYDTDGNMRNMADIVEDLEGALHGMSDEQVRSTLMMMGFQDRSVSAMMTLLGTSGAIREYESDLRSAAGITQKVSDNQLESFAAKWDMLKSRVVDAGISIGERLVPAAEKLMDKVEGLVRWFDRLSPSGQKNVMMLAGLVAAIGPLLWLAGSFSGAIVKIIRLKQMWTAAQIKLNFAMLANPIGLIIAGVAALAFAVYGVVRSIRSADDGIKEFERRSTERFARISHQIGKSMLEAAEETHAHFDSMATGTIDTLLALQTESGTITEETKEKMVSEAEKVRDEVLAALEEKKDRALELLRQEYLEGGEMTEEEYEKQAAEIIAHYEKLGDDVNEGMEEIHEILRQAFIEQRILTKEELDEILGLYEDMYANIIDIEEARKEAEIFLQEELHAIKKEKYKGQNQDIIDSLIEFRDEQRAVIEEAMEAELVQLAAHLKDTGQLTEETWQEEAGKVRERYDEEERNLNTHLQELMFESMAHFRAENVAFDEHSGELVRMRQGHRNEWWQWLKKKNKEEEAQTKEHGKALTSSLQEGADYNGGPEAVGENLGGGVVIGMNRKLPSLLAKARYMVRQTMNAMDDEAQIRSASKVTTKTGENIGLGLEAGIMKLRDKVAAAAEQLAHLAMPEPNLAMAGVGGGSYSSSGSSTSGRAITSENRGAGGDDYGGSPASSGSAAGKREITLVAPVYIDGREVARATATYVDEEIEDGRKGRSRARGGKL